MTNGKSLLGVRSPTPWAMANPNHPESPCSQPLLATTHWVIVHQRPSRTATESPGLQSRVHPRELEEIQVSENHPNRSSFRILSIKSPAHQINQSINQSIRSYQIHVSLTRPRNLLTRSKIIVKSLQTRENRSGSWFSRSVLRGSFPRVSATHKHTLPVNVYMQSRPGLWKLRLRTRGTPTLN